MNDSSLLVIIVMAVATFLTRRLMLSIPEKYLTKRIKRGLVYMPIGVFTALVLPAIFLENGEFEVNLGYVLAGGICIVLYVWKRNFLQSFLGGLVVAIIYAHFI